MPNIFDIIKSIFSINNFRKSQLFYIDNIFFLSSPFVFLQARLGRIYESELFEQLDKIGYVWQLLYISTIIITSFLGLTILLNFYSFLISSENNSAMALNKTLGDFILLFGIILLGELVLNSIFMLIVSR